MNRIILTIILVLGACCQAQETPTGAQTTAPVTVSTLTDNLYVVGLFGGATVNQPAFESKIVASVGFDGILVVDAGFAETSQEAYDSLMTLGNGRLKMIINTHYHGDHVSGNNLFGKDAPILAHRSVLDHLSGHYFSLPGSPDPNRPTVGFEDSLVIYFNGEEIHVVHAPKCHSDGDVYVYFMGSKVVAVGDLLFPDAIPYIDQGSGGTVSAYISQVERFINDFPDDVTFVATHGRSYDKTDLRKYHHMLTETTRLVTEAARAGKTAEQMTEDSLLADFADWAGGFAATSLAFWTQTIYREIVPGSGWGPSICEPLTAILANGTVDDAIAEYRRLKTTQPDAYDFREWQLNLLGYQLMYRQHLEEARAILALNMEMFPESFNVYDSYGEIMMVTGDTAQAIANYEKSIELNPDNVNGVTILKKLRGKN